MTDTLLKIYTRDLGALKKEIKAYESEKLLWITEKDINNSGGNLCLHMVGNLNHFIGATLGNTGYIREREKEFSDKNITLKDLLKRIDETILMVQSVLPKLSEVDLKSTYPIDVFGYEMTTEYFLTHLTTHLSYHLGQLNYHRRLITQ